LTIKLLPKVLLTLVGEAQDVDARNQPVLVFPGADLESQVGDREKAHQHGNQNDLVITCSLAGEKEDEVYDEEGKKRSQNGQQPFSQRRLGRFCLGYRRFDFRILRALVHHSPPLAH
jgi:hypothetical protein